MSGEPERSRESGTRPVPSLAPLSIGLVLGLVSMGVALVLSLWPFAPAFPATLGAIFAVFSLKFRFLRQVVEGLLAATLFGALFLAVVLAGLASCLGCTHASCGPGSQRQSRNHHV